MTVKIIVPSLGESVVEATVSRWLKREGEAIKAGDALVSLETEKVNLEVAAERAGVLVKIARAEGVDVKVGDVLGEIAPGAAPQTALAEPPPAKEKATPVAKQFAEAQGVDLSRVSGSGPGGRVTKEDVQAFVEAQKPAGAAPSAPARPPTVGERRAERRPLSRRRRTIARRLVEAQRTAAILTTFNEIDMGAVMEARNRYKESFEKRHGVRLGFMSFFVKACIGALQEFPQLNAQLDGDDLITQHFYDIGVAIGADEGLVVPVLRDADRMSFAQIEQTIRDFAGKAHNGTLTLDDLRGGTFTITNGGVFGSLLSTPILNPPQAGILGIHKIDQRPAAINGQVVVRPMMFVALSYDHRIVDGREAVQFLVKVKGLIEDPVAMVVG